MRGGCTAVMSSSAVHTNNRFGGGFIEDSFFQHQEIQKLQFLEQQMMFYPPPSAPGGVMHGGGKEVGGHYLKCEVLVEDRIDGGGEASVLLRARESGLGMSRNSPWGAQEDCKRDVQQHSSSSGTEPTSPVAARRLLSTSSSRASPATSMSPDAKHGTPEPRSVLDLATSPRPSSRSAIASFDFTPPSSFGGDSCVLLDSHDEFLSGFCREASAEILSLDGDSSQWDPPTKNSSDCLEQQTSPLWMDSLIDDLGQEPAPCDEYSPSSTPSEECNKSPSNELEQSEEEETTNNGTSAEDSPTIQQVQSGSFREEAPSREVGLELVNLLLSCAEAVSTKNLSLVNPLFAQLGELASPKGTSMQRVAAYFTEGLATRCSHLWPNLYQPLPYNLDLSEEDSLSAFHILNHVCPYTKFAHFTANEIILQVFEGCDRVHVIDFDIKQGLQWPALFQGLAARTGGPPSHVRITGVGECKEDVQDTGDRLAEFAEALGLEFEFHAVIDKLEDVRLWMLHVKEKEVVAVNCNLQLHRTLHDPENGIKDMLGLIASTKAKVVAIVEQEANHNGAFFAGRTPRFLESLQYYAAIFDSLDLNMPKDSMARTKVEQFFAREIRNILACEGPERVERHESIEAWRGHLDMGGFKSVAVSRRAKTQARLLLEMFSCKSYTVTEDEGALILGWRDRPLFSASAWTPK